eukprot:3418246-Rhodomonas_salina.1
MQVDEEELGTVTEVLSLPLSLLPSLPLSLLPSLPPSLSLSRSLLSLPAPLSHPLSVYKMVVLKEGGEKLPVTNENKEEYVRLYRASLSAHGSASSGTETVHTGFFEIVPKDVLLKFSEQVRRGARGGRG